MALPPKLREPSMGILSLEWREQEEPFPKFLKVGRETQRMQNNRGEGPQGTEGVRQEREGPAKATHAGGTASAEQASQ